MLENGTHVTIAEIDAAEKINESYVGRVLRSTLLAPDIRGDLAGRQPAEVTLGADGFRGYGLPSDRNFYIPVRVTDFHQSTRFI